MPQTLNSFHKNDIHPSLVRYPLQSYCTTISFFLQVFFVSIFCKGDDVYVDIHTVHNGKGSSHLCVSLRTQSFSILGR